MLLKNKYLSIIVISSFMIAIYALSTQMQEHENPMSPLIKGPAIILFKGDNSASCRKINLLIEQAKIKYQNTINISLNDWSKDNHLVKKYNVLFLPSVIFIDSKGNEVKRIVGESLAVQKKLSQALSQADQLLVN